MASLKLVTILSVIALVHGGPTKETFIDGGRITSPDEHPFLAFISTDYGPPGGLGFYPGVILNERTILTAARSVYGQNKSFTIMVGARDIIGAWEEERRQRFEVSPEAVTIHPEYDPTYRPARDIALIRLSSRITYTEWVKPVPLLPKAAIDSGFEFARQSGTVFGWSKNATAVIAYTNQIPLNVQCVFAVYTYHLCLYGEFDQGPWTHDSGAPLFSKYEGKDVLVGVLSFTSVKGPEFGEGSVYSRLSYFANWIEANSDVRFV